MHLISQTLPVLAPCICNTARGRSADRWLHTACNNKHGTQEETRDPAWLPVLIGNPSSPCWPSNFHGPVWVTYNTVTSFWMCYAPLWLTLSIVSHCLRWARLRPGRINSPLSLAQNLSSSLMKCNLPSSNIIHHTPAAVLVCELVCVCAERLLHICISALVFSFFCPTDCRRTSRAQMTLRWPNKRACLAHLFSFFLSFFPCSFCLVWNQTHTSNFPSIWWLSEFWAVLDFHIDLRYAGEAEWLSSVDLCTAVPQLPSSS